MLAARPSFDPRGCETEWCQDCRDIGGEITLGGDCRFADGTIVAKPKSGSGARPGRGVSFAGARRKRRRGAQAIRMGSTVRGCSPTSCPYGMECVMGRCQYVHEPPAFMGRRGKRRRRRGRRRVAAAVHPLLARPMQPLSSCADVGKACTTLTGKAGIVKAIGLGKCVCLGPVI